jgi:hypothetical protein
VAGDYGERTRFQRVWLAGACGLLGVLLFGGGWLVMRGITTSPPPATVPTGPASAASASAGDVGLGAPGFVDGVPWGYPLDPAGAAAAGVTAVAVTGQPEVAFDPDRFTEVAAVVFTHEEAATQARQVDAARTQFELSGWAEQPASRRMYHLAPLAVRLTAFDPDAVTARVEVWAMTLVGVGDTGGAVFTTSTIDLAADDTTGTWRVTALDTLEGPVPLVLETASAPGRTRALVRDAAPVLPLPLPDLSVVEPAS